MKLQISNCKKAAVQDGMIGLFFEDINYAADGGLYAEMIENRSFSFVDCYGDVGDYYTKPAWGYGWNATKECGEGRMEYVTGSPISRVNPWYLRFTAQDAGQGFWNKAYDGIYLEKGKTYTVRFYARAAQYPEGDITVQVTKDGRICAQAEVSCIHAPEKTWQKWNLYEAVLEAGETIRNGRFTISLTKPGTVEFDLISMMPDDAVAGVFRKDLFDLLKGLHPGFFALSGWMYYRRKYTGKSLPLERKRRRHQRSPHEFQSLGSASDERGKRMAHAVFSLQPDPRYRFL